MLILTRKVGEKIRLGKNVTIKVVKVIGNRVKIGIDAPESLNVVREELESEPAEETEVAS
jgi:carbon storage regulator